MGRTILSCLAILIVLAWAGPLCARAAPQDRYVALGGGRLHLIVHRDGKPIVLLESGAGLDAGEWDSVVDQLLPRTEATIVAYDRAGMGKSTPLATPYDIHEEVGRLHKALYLLGLDHPLILVGHSYGGFLIQLYANLYPGDVAGLVYVDANTVDGLGGPEGASKFMDSIRQAEREGHPPFPDMRLAEALEATTRMMIRYPPPCGIPVTVLTRGKPNVPLSDFLARWRAGHQALAKATGGSLIYAEKSGHMIPRDQPELVANAITAQIGTISTSRKHIYFPSANGRCARVGDIPGPARRSKPN